MFLELIKLSLEGLNMLQIMAKLISGDKGLFVIDPEHNFFSLPKELNENKSLL